MVADTLIQTASIVGTVGGIGVMELFGAGLGGGIGATILGKVIWGFLDNPHKQCKLHGALSEDVAIIKTNVTWLVEEYRRNRGNL